MVGVVTATADDELEAFVGVCLACLAGVGAMFIGGDAIFMRRFVAYNNILALVMIQRNSFNVFRAEIGSMADASIAAGKMQTYLVIFCNARIDGAGVAFEWATFVVQSHASRNIV